jgi:CubicO group peptidase (beta-lactamase class C family)
MHKRTFFSGFLLALSVQVSRAQLSHMYQSLSAFQEAERGLVLLRDEASLLPLRALDTLRAGMLFLGGNAPEALRTAKLYAEVDLMTPPQAENFASWAATNARRFNTYIVVLDSLAPPIDTGMARWLSEPEIIVVVLGEPVLLRSHPWLANCRGAVLYSPLLSAAPSLSIQAVFGAAPIEGRLDEAIEGLFPAGAGLLRPGGSRLRYSPPEALGMDGTRLRDSIRAIVEEGIALGAYPGAQVLVARSGQVVFHEAFGHHTYEKDQQVRLDDVYDFASITKITTGLPAAMKLYGEGRFNLDAPLGAYFPEWANSNKGALSFRRMLTHSARLRAWIPFWRGALRGNARYPWRKRWNNDLINEGRFKARSFSADSSARYPTRVTERLWLHRGYKDRIMESIRRSPLNDKPGYVYSDLSFYLWPEILPRLTGQPFEPYLKETFYRRLGAHTLTFNAYRHFPPERIVPTENDTFFRRTLLRGFVHDEGAAMLSGISGHAGLFGCANDLAKLMQMYLNGGEYGGERFISAEAIAEFTRYQYPEEEIRRGLGFDKPSLEFKPGEHYIARAASPASYGHTGYTGTFVWVDPDNQLLLVFFTNRVHPTRDNRLLIERAFRPRLHQTLYELIPNE